MKRAVLYLLWCRNFSLRVVVKQIIVIKIVGKRAPRKKKVWRTKTRTNYEERQYLEKSKRQNWNLYRMKSYEHVACIGRFSKQCEESACERKEGEKSSKK
jgi:hypothetical protein